VEQLVMSIEHRGAIISSRRMEMPTHRIFLSHSHMDNAWCEQLVQHLHRTGLDVWFDKQGLYGGDDWVQMIERELESRDIYLFVITPDSWSSDWVRKELALAFARHKRVIGIIHKPTDITGFLMTYQLLDATTLTTLEAAHLVLQSMNLAPTSSQSVENAERTDSGDTIIPPQIVHIQKQIVNNFEEYIIRFQVRTSHVIRRRKSNEMKTAFQLLLDDRLIKEDAFVVGKIEHDFVVEGVLFTYTMHVQWLWYSEQLSAQNKILWRFPRERAET
jgi:hypothetical protein